MSPSSDDEDVKFFRRDPETNSSDAQMLHAVANALAGLTPAHPPTASPELATLLAQGRRRRYPMQSQIQSAFTRIAGLGVATKVLLATGVAVASAGSAVGAVAIDHAAKHHNHHHTVQQPRDNRGGAGVDATQTPVADDNSVEPGDDRGNGQEIEPGDDRGGHNEAEPGDDRGNDNNTDDADNDHSGPGRGGDDNGTVTGDDNNGSGHGGDDGDDVTGDDNSGHGHGGTDD